VLCWIRTSDIINTDLLGNVGVGIKERKCMFRAILSDFLYINIA